MPGKLPERKISDLSYKVLTYPDSVGRFVMDDCVDWAVEMMALGYEGENLHILAGLVKPVLYFEAVDYLKKALQEVGLAEVIGTAATLSNAVYHIKQLSKGDNVADHLAAVCYNISYYDFDEIFTDFLRLHWEWEELKHNNPYREYWPEVTLGNIESTTVNVAQTWLTIHRHLYEGLVTAK